MSENYNQQLPSSNQVLYPRTSTWAIVSLVSSILSWMGLFGIGGIAGIICGHIAKNEIRNSQNTVSGDGLATAGLILGYANVALTILAIIAVIVLPILGVAICGGAGIFNEIFQ